MLHTLKNIVKLFSADISVLIIAIVKAYKIKNETIKRSSIFLGEIWQQLYTLSNLDIHSLITAEADNLCYYSNCLESIESFKIDNVSQLINLKPDDNITYTVLEYKSFKKLLKLEIIKLRLLILFEKNFESKLYLRKSLNKLLDLYKFKIDSKISSKTLNYKLYGSIQFYKNQSESSFNLSYKNAIILSNKKAANKRKTTKHNTQSRLIIFYFDNFSKYTKELISKEKDRFPCLSSFFNNDSFITLENTMSVSNWTYPAAVSMLSGQRFEEHLKYFPYEKCYLDLIYKFYKSDLKEKYPNLFDTYSLRFRSGNNWRMKQHHGLHSIFTHCFSNESKENKLNSQYTDIYSVVSQSIKQFDISSKENSMHWIDIMDSHHPVKNSILPIGSRNLKPHTLINGLQYQNGAKYPKGKSTESSKDIYLAQIASIDFQLEKILNHSYTYLPKEQHSYIFVSDHGTHFMRNGSKLSEINELHNPMIGFLSNSKDNNLEIQSRIKHFHPSNIFSLIDYMASNNIRSDQDTLFENFSYSHVIFPNKPYQLFINFNKNKIYTFYSNEKLPKTFLRNKQELKLLLSKFLFNGTWYLISPDEIEELLYENLPKELKIFIDKLFN